LDEWIDSKLPYCFSIVALREQVSIQRNWIAPGTFINGVISPLAGLGIDLEGAKAPIISERIKGNIQVTSIFSARQPMAQKIG